MFVKNPVKILDRFISNVTQTWPIQQGVTRSSTYHRRLNFYVSRCTQNYHDVSKVFRCTTRYMLPWDLNAKVNIIGNIFYKSQVSGCTPLVTVHCIFHILPWNFHEINMFSTFFQPWNILLVNYMLKLGLIKYLRSIFKKFYFYTWDNKKKSWNWYSNCRFLNPITFGWSSISSLSCTSKKHPFIT